MIIFVEGIDGVGKTTAIEYISNFFNSDFKVVKQPLNSEIIKIINTYIRRSEKDVIKAVELLFLADQFLTKSELDLENNIIFDRSWLSTLAYQTVNIGYEYQLRIMNIINELPQPDKVYYLHTNNTETNMERIGKKKATGVIDPDSLAYLERVKSNYEIYLKFLFENCPSKVVYINSEDNSVEEVKDIIIKDIKNQPAT